MMCLDMTKCWTKNALKISKNIGKAECLQVSQYGVTRSVLTYFQHGFCESVADARTLANRLRQKKGEDCWFALDIPVRE